MQRNKYLDALDIPMENYGTNFLNDDDPRAEKWREEKEQYGFDSRECWSLDQTFLEWLYSHFMKYKEDAKTTIVLSGPKAHKFQYINKEIDQLEAIDIIIDACKSLLTSKDYYLNNKYLSKDIMVLLGDLLPSMWW